MTAVGVLALQGDFEAHSKIVEALGAEAREVRVPEQLADLDALIIPGGESTTMTIGVEREGLAQPVHALAQAGLPMFGSCAGMVMLDRQHLGVMDIAVERNAFGRQINSFEADLELGPDGELDGLAEGPLRAVFIRAPWIVEHGPEVEVLASVDGHPVAARQGHVLAVAFHSELVDDDRLHRLFLGWARGYARAGGASRAGGSGGLARSSASQP